MGLYNDRNDVFGVTSLGVFHARLPWPLPNIIYVDVAVRCDPFASMRIPITFPPSTLVPFLFLPLSSFRFSSDFWATPRLRFVSSFARSSCFQADFQCQRFGDNEVWTGIVSFTFFCLFFLFLLGCCFFFVVLLWRVCFVFVFFFSLFRNKNLHTRFM